MTPPPGPGYQSRPSPNAHLIGQAGGRFQLSTPCLILDIDAMERNVARMAAHCAGLGVTLRPHGKAHKCVEIARRQIAGGAVGLCVVNIGEAEVFAAAGIPGILITSPLSTEAKMRRFVRLAAGTDVATVVDNPDGAKALAEMARADGVRLPIMLDLDLGRARTGVTEVADAIDLGKLLASDPAFDLRGMQAYAGHLSHEPDHAARRSGAVFAAAKIRDVVDGLAAEGVEIETVSGGSTGTCFMEPQAGGITEAQFGSYVFMDAEYDEIPLTEDHDRPFEPSLFVAVSVVSRSLLNQATADGGYKHFLGKHAAPQIVRGLADGTVAAYALWSDEHGRIDIEAGGDELAPGHILECWVPHCDPTLNLYDHLHVVRGDDLVDIWSIDARGVY